MRALITDGVHESLLKGLQSLGYACDYRPEIKLEEVRKIIDQYEGLIINSKILVDKLMLDNGVKLKFVGRLGSGMEIVDLSYAAQKGVAIFSAPEGNCNAVAEHALGMLLALANNFIKGDKEVRQKIWDRESNRGFEVMGRTIGIVGFGHTGSAFAQKLQGMGMRILAYDKYKIDYTANFPYVEESDMSTIIKEADVISFHLPLTDEVHHLVNEDLIAQCQKAPILINTSRGRVVKTQALIDGLKNGKVSGACLDVYENEKPHLFTAEEDKMYAQLYQLPNTILSPHVAGWTVESKKRLATVLINKIKGLHSGT